MSESGYWLQVFRNAGALWLHDSAVPTAPHAVLASGRHSNGYFNATKVVQRPYLLREVVDQLLKRELVSTLVKDFEPNWVFG